MGQMTTSWRRVWIHKLIVPNPAKKFTNIFVPTCSFPCSLELRHILVPCHKNSVHKFQSSFSKIYFNIFHPHTLIDKCQKCNQSRGTVFQLIHRWSRKLFFDLQYPFRFVWTRYLIRLIYILPIVYIFSIFIQLKQNFHYFSYFLICSRIRSYMTSTD
jgi:hypothetical protein